MEDLFRSEADKSKLVNELLEAHYSKRGTVGKVKEVKINKSQQAVEPLLSIPGVEKASEAKCKGTHYPNRKDCGKKDCPWKGIK